MSLLAKARQGAAAAKGSGFPEVDKADLAELAELVEAWCRGEVSNHGIVSTLSGKKAGERAQTPSVIVAAVKRLVCHGFRIRPARSDPPSQ